MTRRALGFLLSGLYILSRSLCCAILLIPFLGAEPPATIADTIEEQRVPAASLTSEMLQGRVPVPLEKYQRLKRLHEARRDAPVRTRLVKAEYSATYSGHRFTEGRMSWTIQHPQSSAESWCAGGLGLALRDLHWKNELKDDQRGGDQPAIWGMSAERQFEVVVDRTQGQLNGTWELEGETIVRHDEFLFRVPQATVSVLKLRVATGFTVTVPGQILPQAAAPEPGWNVWTIPLGGQSECRISLHPPLPPSVTTPLILVRSQAAYSLRQDGLRYSSELNLEVSQAPIREIVFLADAELEIYSITHGDIALPWKTEHVEGRQRLVVTLPDPLLGSSRILRLRGVAPIKTESAWKLPNVSVAGSVLDLVQSDLRVSPPLQLQELQTDGYLQTSIESPSSRDEWLTFKQFRPESSLRVMLVKPQPRILARVTSDLQMQATDWSCVTQFQLTATEGAAFELKCRIPAGWDVIDVRDVNSPKLEWNILTVAPGERLLALRFLEALSADKPRTIEVDARRGSDSADQTFAVPAFEPLGVNRLELVVGISSTTEVKPVLDAGTSFEVCEEAEIDSDWTQSKFWRSRLAERGPKLLLLRLNGIAPEGHFTLQSLQTPVEVSADMRIQFASDKLTKTITLHVSPQRGRTERVLVYQSELGPQLNWTLAGTPPRSVEVRKLPAIQSHAAWGLPSTGELSELRLPQPQAGPFILEGVRTRGLPITGRLGLVFVPQARVFRGQVSVEAPAELGLELTAEKTESDGVTEAIPGPVKRNWSFHEPGATLKFQTRAAAGRAPAPVIRRATLEARWTLEPETNDYYRAKLELGSGIRGSELRVLLPDSVEVVEIQIDSQPIQFHPPQTGTPLILTDIADEQVVTITYRAPSQVTSNPVHRTIVMPQLNIPVLRFDLELMTPVGYRLGAEPRGMVLKSTEGSISTLQRLFGPLGRPSSDTWFNPFSLRPWIELFSDGESSGAVLDTSTATFHPTNSVHSGWQVFRGSAALLPEQIDVWLWSNRQASCIAWLAFWGCLLLGAMLRLGRMPSRGLLVQRHLSVKSCSRSHCPAFRRKLRGPAWRGHCW